MSLNINAAERLSEGQVVEALREPIGTFLRNTPFIAQNLPADKADTVSKQIMQIIWEAMDENLTTTSSVGPVVAELGGGDRVHLSACDTGYRVSYEIGTGKHQGRMLSVAMIEDAAVANQIFASAKQALYETQFLRSDAKMADARRQIAQIQSHYRITAAKTK